MKGLPDNGRRELASRDEANLILNFVIPMQHCVMDDKHHQERAAYHIKTIIIVIIFIQKVDQGKTMGRLSRALSSETRWQSLFSTRVLILSEKSTQFTFIHFRLGIFIAEHSNNQLCISLQEPSILCPQILAKISLEFFTLH